MLLATIKSNAQNDSLKSKGIPILNHPSLAYYYGTPDNNTYSILGGVKLQQFKIHIDSVYLQRIIEALEEKGYTLVKLPKRNK